MSAMHDEALRKKRVLERKQMALQRMAQDEPSDCDPQLTGGRPDHMQMEQAAAMNAIHAEQNRLTKFRVNDDGFRNRYRARAHMAPHVDRMYAIVYPGGENADYTADPLRNERRQNRAESNYDARRRVNGVRFVPGHVRDQVYSTIHPMEDRSAFYEYGQTGPMVYGGQGVEYHRMQYDHSRNGPTRPYSWNEIQRQLKHEAKVLRDHNLYMGHTSAFKDLYDRGVLDPSKPC